MLSMVFVMVTMSAASAERVTEVINETADLHDPQDPVMEVADGSIEFDHVDFSYKKDSKEPVLKDINLSIRAGETIGINGGTGSAKSSLVNLISCFPVPFWRICAGEIKRLRRKSAAERVSFPVRMTSLRKCRTNTILILSRAEPMFPAVRNSVCVSPELFLRNPKY